MYLATTTSMDCSAGNAPSRAGAGAAANAGACARAGAGAGGSAERSAARLAGDAWLAAPKRNDEVWLPGAAWQFSCHSR